MEYRYRIARIGLFHRKSVLVLQVGRVVNGVRMPAGSRCVEKFSEMRWRDARPAEFLETPKPPSKAP